MNKAELEKWLAGDIKEYVARFHADSLRTIDSIQHELVGTNRRLAENILTLQSGQVDPLSSELRQLHAEYQQLSQQYQQWMGPNTTTTTPTINNAATIDAQQRERVRVAARQADEESERFAMSYIGAKDSQPVDEFVREFRQLRSQFHRLQNAYEQYA